MKQIFIAGNWKSNKTNAQAKEWLEKFGVLSSGKTWNNATVVVCAPYTTLAPMQWAIGSAKLPLSLAAQDVSAYPEGAYTGEVSGTMVKEVADWVIIGHSERRKYFGETDEMLAKKVNESHVAGVKVIYCVQDDTTPVPAGVEVVAYEPVWAIGTGKADSPENASGVVASIKSKTGAKTVIYGGSVVADNVASFVSTPSIDGVLPGGASLDPEKFFALISAATSVA